MARRDAAAGRAPPLEELEEARRIEDPRARSQALGDLLHRVPQEGMGPVLAATFATISDIDTADERAAALVRTADSISGEAGEVLRPLVEKIARALADGVVGPQASELLAELMDALRRVFPGLNLSELLAALSLLLGDDAGSEEVDAVQEEEAGQKEAPVSGVTRGPRLDVGALELSNSVLRAFDWAVALRESADVDEIDTTLLLGGILLAVRSGMTQAGSAQFLLGYLRQHAEGGQADDEEWILGLLRRADISALPSYPGDLQRDVPFADDVASVVTGVHGLTTSMTQGDGSRIRMRDLVVALLAPARTGVAAQTDLTDQGYDLDDLRASLVDHLRARPLLVATLPHGAPLGAATASPFAPLVGTIARNGTASIWVIADGSRLSGFDRRQRVAALGFADEATGVALTEDGRVEVWHFEGGGVTGLGDYGPPDERAFALATCPTRGVVAVGASDGRASLWNMATGSEVGAVVHPTSCHAVALSPDGRWLASASMDGAFSVWTASIGELLRVESSPALSIAFSPDGRHVAIGCMDGTARAWKLPPSADDPVEIEHAGPVISVVFHSNGEGVASSDIDGPTHMWETASGRLISDIPQGSRTLAASLNGRQIASSSGGGTVRIWDPSTGEDAGTVEHGAEVSSVEFAPDGDLITASSDSSGRVWRPLDAGALQRLRELLGLSEFGGPILAGYRPDDLSGPDALEIGREVKTLCAVLAAADVHPPLSVGLFGDWGTGKSYFMQMMRHEINELARRAMADREANKKQYFCPYIRQITFNAWNYSDANLWASLVTRIFEGLASEDPDHPPDRAEAKKRDDERRKVLQTLELAKEELRDAQRREQAASEEKRAAERELSAIGRELEDTRERVATVAEQDLATAVSRDPWVQRGVAQLGERLGEDVPVEEKELPELAALPTTLKSLWKRWKTIDRRVRKRIGWIVAGVLALAAVLATIAAWLLARNAGTIEAAIGAVVVVAGTLERGARWILHQLKTISDLAKHAQRLLERASKEAEQRQAREVADLNARVAALSAHQSAMQVAVAEKATALAAAKADVEDVQLGRRLSRFIQERSASADYRQHLGILALVRRDFENLIGLLEQVQGDGRARRDYARAGLPDLPPINRIILYIDDLDRCPPALVVDVLQAVHLLLALPLFVVVVGVDPRWLLRSLERHYKELLTSPQDDRDTGEPDGQHWSTTAQNYLEKIFQIPYTLPKMEPAGYGRLVESLVPVKPESGQAGAANVRVRTPAAAGAAASSAGAGHEAGVSPGEAPPNDGAPSRNASETVPAGPTRPVPLPVATAPTTQREEIEPASLEIEEVELAFMRQLAPLIDTPRSAKRLVNIYRLLRVSLTKWQLRMFVDPRGDHNEYQPAMTLLAMMTGFPAQAADVFPAILEQRTTTSWWEFVGDLRPVGPDAEGMFRNSVRDDLSEDDVETWNRMCDGLEQLRSSTTRQTIKAFASWVQPVARFSFRPGREIQRDV